MSSLVKIFFDNRILSIISSPFHLDSKHSPLQRGGSFLKRLRFKVNVFEVEAFAPPRCNQV